MTFIDFIKMTVKSVLRKKTPVTFGDFARIEPVSRFLGTERGKPIDRQYIDAFLNAERKQIRGSALEVGELRYVPRFGHDILRQSVLAISPKAVSSHIGLEELIIADLSLPETVPEGDFDCFVCTQTLNFIYDFKSAIQSARRLLKPGGSFIGTVAGISPISRYDADRWGDYWRFTEMSLGRLLTEIFGPNITIRSYGNALTAQAFLQGLCCEDFPDYSVFEKNDKDFPVVIGFVAIR